MVDVIQIHMSIWVYEYVSMWVYEWISTLVNGTAQTMKIFSMNLNNISRYQKCDFFHENRASSFALIISFYKIGEKKINWICFITNKNNGIVYILIHLFNR